MKPPAEHRPGRTAAPEIFQLFDSLFHGAREGVLLTQTSGTVIRANQAACVALGRTEDEIRRLGRDGLVVPDAEATRLAEKRQRTRHGVGELALRRADGSSFQAEFTSSILPPSGSVSLSIVIFRDVTEERATVSALEESRLRLALALDGSEMGSWDWIVGEPTVTVSRRWMEILDVPGVEEEAVYSTALWMEAIHPDDSR
jgi:PAS domain S-box-containing protein